MKWQFKPMEANSWVEKEILVSGSSRLEIASSPRSERRHWRCWAVRLETMWPFACGWECVLRKMGYLKLIQREDERQAIHGPTEERRAVAKSMVAHLSPEGLHTQRWHRPPWLA